MHIKFFLSLIFALMLHAVPAFAMNCGTCNAAIEGKICYASDDKTLMLCNGSTWVDQSASCGLAMPSHSCGTCNTANNGKICYETTAGMTFFCNGESWRGTRLMTPAPATSLNACGYTERGVIGTWNGHNVDTRQFTRNGQNEWVLTVAITDSTVDKHFPRGDNFLGAVTLNGSFNSSCLNGGETAWYGLSKPSGMTTPAHYEAGTEADGAQFFQHKEYCTRDAVTGPIQCWGDAAYGGTTPSPAIVAKSVVGGDSVMCAIKQDNTVQCWGSTSYGVVPSPAISAKKVVVGNTMACAIKLDDTVQCWGTVSFGTLNPPTTITAKDIAVGHSSACAIKTDNTVQCWGVTNMGGTTPSPVISAKALIASPLAMCAIKMDNTLQCWGDGGSGGYTPSPAINVKSLYSSYYAICAVKTDDILQCSGNGSYGGNAPGSLSTSYVNSAPGASTICAMKTNGTGRCWGSYNYDDGAVIKDVGVNQGQLCRINNDNSVTCFLGNTYGAVSAKSKLMVGSGAMCVIQIDDTVRCWGDAAQGGTTPSPTIKAQTITVSGGMRGFGRAFCAIKK
jgi:hypothetical protein